MAAYLLLHATVAGQSKILVGRIGRKAYCFMSDPSAEDNEIRKPPLPRGSGGLGVRVRLFSIWVDELRQSRNRESLPRFNQPNEQMNDWIESATILAALRHVSSIKA